MTMQRDLNALLGSRICHDLISPLGAIGNGVELLAMSGINAAPEIALISESVENANARIRFFRVAFGASSPGQMVGRPEIMSILNDMTKGGRLDIDWRPTDDVLRAQVKLAFLLLQCLESASIRPTRSGACMEVPRK
jgi:histidine phosphotransferase ChpT